MLFFTFLFSRTLMKKVFFFVEQSVRHSKLHSCKLMFRVYKYNIHSKQPLSPFKIDKTESNVDFSNYLATQSFSILDCTLITSLTTFTFTITCKTYNILHNLSCHSHNVIYLITCSLCSKQYVGLTSSTLRYVNIHRFNINNDGGDTVAKHFNLPGHIINHAKITPIDQLLTADIIGLLNKETFWIHTLQTLQPHGININDQATFPITQIH